MKTTNQKVNDLVNLFKTDLDKFKSEMEKIDFNFVFGISFFKNYLRVTKNDFTMEIFKQYDPLIKSVVKFVPNNSKTSPNENKLNIIIKLPEKYIIELFDAADKIRSELDWEYIQKNNFEYIPDIFFKNNKLIEFLIKVSKLKQINELMSMHHFSINNLGTTWQY